METKKSLNERRNARISQTFLGGFSDTYIKLAEDVEANRLFLVNRSNLGVSAEDAISIFGERDKGYKFDRYHKLKILNLFACLGDPLAKAIVNHAEENHFGSYVFHECDVPRQLYMRNLTRDEYFSLLNGEVPYSRLDGENIYLGQPHEFSKPTVFPRKELQQLRIRLKQITRNRD